MIWFVVLGLFIGRVVGWMHLPLMILTAFLYVWPFDSTRARWVVACSFLFDVLVGVRFGMSGLLLLLLYFEISLIKEKLGAVGGGVLFLVSLLATAQATIVWSESLSWWWYLINGFTCLLVFFYSSGMERRGMRGGVYLRS